MPSKAEISFITTHFMKRLDPLTATAIAQVLSGELNQLQASERYGITHQAVSKNIKRFNHLHALLKEYARRY